MPRGPHRRDVTQILSKVSCFLLKSFHFSRLQKRQVFSHANPYILNVIQQCRCSPMLIFRAWATCAENETDFKRKGGLQAVYLRNKPHTSF